jgi:hypothetical protein
MKAISLKQPYASWIAEGKKTIETRTWSTKYRGDIVICASQSGVGKPKGVALCIVELYGIRTMVKADEPDGCVECYPNAKAWLIRNLRLFDKPFPVKGQLSLYDIEIPTGVKIVRQDAPVN